MSSRAAALLSVTSLMFAILFVSPSNAQDVTTYATGVGGARDLAWDAEGTLYVSGNAGGIVGE